MMYCPRCVYNADQHADWCSYNTGLQPGWMNRQIKRVQEDVEKWPDWMKREARFNVDDELEGTTACNPDWEV